MGLMDQVEKLINEHGSSSILRDRLDLVKEQAEVLERKVKDLEQLNSVLEARCQELEERLKTHAAPDNFIEHEGALFQRKPDGSYREQVFCPKCHQIASSPLNEIEYQCKCGWSGRFSGRQLKRVMSTLP